MLSLQTIVARYHVRPLVDLNRAVLIKAQQFYRDLSRHLGSSAGFFAHWLPSCSAVYPLSSLDQAGTLALQGWVGGLFGEGISDELMQYV